MELFKHGFLVNHIYPSIWLKNTLHFRMRSCHEHYILKWGDVTDKTTLDGKVYLIMEKRISKGRDAAVAGKHSYREFKTKMFALGAENCLIETHRVYRQRRPEPMLDKNVNLKGQIWYRNQRLGISSLSKLLKGIGEKAALNKNKNVRNHSPRKTMLNDLCKENVPSYRIIQLFGHKRVNLIEDYHRAASIKHEEEMSRILSKNTSGTPRPFPSDPSTNKMNLLCNNKAKAPSQPQLQFSLNKHNCLVHMRQ